MFVEALDDGNDDDDDDDDGLAYQIILLQVNCFRWSLCQLI